MDAITAYEFVEGNQELVGIAGTRDTLDSGRGVIKYLGGTGEGNRKACSIAGPVIHYEDEGLAGGDVDTRHEGGLAGIPLQRAGLRVIGI
jgi:hypothetical protein